VAATLMLLAFACGGERRPRDAGTDSGIELPAGNWRIEIDRPSRGEEPSVALTVGASAGRFQWDGRSLLGGMDERHTGDFVTERSDLVAVWREVTAQGFFDLRDGARDPSGMCESISYRGVDRAVAKCVDHSPDAERLRRIVRTVESVVRRHAQDFDLPTSVTPRMDSCHTDADCVLDSPILRCCPSCPAPMTRALQAWHGRLAARCPNVDCEPPSCTVVAAGVGCDPNSKVCIAAVQER